MHRCLTAFACAAMLIVGFVAAQPALAETQEQSQAEPRSCNSCNARHSRLKDLRAARADPSPEACAGGNTGDDACAVPSAQGERPAKE